MTYAIEISGYVRARRGFERLPYWNGDLGCQYEFATRFDAEQFVKSQPKPDGFEFHIVCRD